MNPVINALYEAGSAVKAEFIAYDGRPNPLNIVVYTAAAISFLFMGLSGQLNLVNGTAGGALAAGGRCVAKTIDDHIVRFARVVH